MSAVNGNYRISFHHQQPKKILGILPSTKMKNKLLFEFWSNTLFLNDVGASGSIEVDFFRDCDVKNRIGKKIRENIEGKKEKLKGKEDKKTTGIQLITLGKDEQQQKDEEGGVGEKKKLLPLPSLRIHVVRGSVRVGKETALARVTGGDEEATL